MKINSISNEQLLNQIRSLGKELQVTSAPTDVAKPEFGATLKNTLDAVNDAQRISRDMKIGFETGSGDASLAEVMIASQKANLSFRAVTEVRNKLITAYQDIMNMPV